MCFTFDQIFPDRSQIVMPYSTHIVTAEMAHTFSARAHRTCGIVRDRIPREVRRESLAPCPSGEMESASFPRECDGVRERDVRSEWVDRHPSGKSDAASLPRERIDVPEREHRSDLVAAHPLREITLACIGSGDHLRAFPQSASKNPFPSNNPHRATRYQRRCLRRQP